MILSLVLGIAVTLATSWISPFLAKPKAHGWGLTSDDGPGWMYFVHTTSTGTRITRQPVSLSAARNDVQFIEASYRRLRKIGLPMWSRARTNPRIMPDDPDPLIEDAHGWPMRAFVSHARISVPGYVDNVQWGWPVAGVSGKGENLIIVPFRPIVLGLAVDICLFAMIPLLVYGAARTAKRTLRLRRGRCAACGYPRTKGERCPECGGAYASDSHQDARSSSPDAMG